MASKAKTQQEYTRLNGVSEPVPFRGFANYYLPESEKPKFDVYVQSPDAWTDFKLLIDDGYKFSIRFDERTLSYMCSVTNQCVTHPDVGIAYTERSKDPVRAIFKAVYALRQQAISGCLANYVVGKRQPDW